MKLAPRTTARFPFTASAMMARLSRSVRNTCTRAAPGGERRTGSEPVARTMASKVRVDPSSSLIVFVFASSIMARRPVISSMFCSR